MWQPRGLQLLADNATAALFQVHWQLWTLGARLPWTDALKWALYPLAYLANALIRGALTGLYPYSPFVDVPALGIGRVMANALALLVPLFAIAAVLRRAGQTLLAASPSAAAVLA